MAAQDQKTATDSAVPAALDAPYANPAVDPATGLASRWAFQARLVEEWERSRRYRRPLSLLYVFIGSLKAIGAAHGREAADAAIKDVGSILQSTLRTSDFVFRFDEDALVVLLTETAEDGARLLAERLRNSIAARPLPSLSSLFGPKQPPAVLVAFGAAAYPSDVDSPLDLVDRAKAAAAAAATI